VLEDDRSVARVVLVEGDAFMGMPQKHRQDALPLFDRRTPQVFAIEFEEVERAEHGCGIVTVSADQDENARPRSLQTTASPSIRQERTGSTVRAATICGKRFEKLLPLALRRFSGSPFLVAIGGIADVSSGRPKCRN
jgi:hypothetical protein